MIRTLINFLKHPPEPINGWAKAAIIRGKPIIRRASRRARATASTPVLGARLGLFLSGRSKVEFTRADAPRLSVILVVQGRAEFALACLSSLVAQPGNFEVVIIDNASTGLTRRMLRRLEGATIVRSEGRLTLPQARRLAVERSRGELVAFVDPDSRFQPGSLTAALETIQSRADVGAVVGKTVRLDGLLEEAGSILWRDGSTSAYGEGREPEAPEFMFTREVDFSSGAFLLTTRNAFEVGAGGEGGTVLDRIALGASLRGAGSETVYDPRVALIRLSRPPAGSTPERRDVVPEPARVAERLGSRLQSQLPRTDRNLTLARNRSVGRLRVLFIEDRVPYLTLGAGYPRANSIVAAMVKLGYVVTYYPTNIQFRLEQWSDVYRCVDRRVEVMIDHSSKNVGDFLKARAGNYDVILISRPNNMEVVKPFLPAIRADGRPRIVYDAEALFSARTIERLRLSGNEPSLEQQREMIEAEVRLVDDCSAILSVSAKDARSFSDHGAKEVYILSHSIDPSPTPTPFERRTGFLFVGPVYTYETPNADSITWFAREVYPRIRKSLGDDPQFQVAGAMNAPGFVENNEGPGIHFLGRVDDLTSAYDSARIFVAPTRFAAGIPFKCGEAAALGLPIVATALLADQLGWEDGVDLLVAHDAESFAAQCARLYQDPDLWGRLRANALRRIETSYSAGSFSATIQQALGAVPTPIG